MKIKKIKVSLNYCVIIIFCLILISCDTDKNKRGYEYFPEMVYSESYETYAPNPIYADGKTAQPPA
jgi:hypothetical protein